MLDDLIVGDVIEGEVVDFASGGEGIVKLNGYPVFIPFALKGERVRARATYIKKDCAFGELIEVVEKSEERVKPVCPYFGRCGGCDLQHMSSKCQQIFKRDAIKTTLKKVAGEVVDVPLPVRVNEFGYRNKLSLPFFKNKVSGRVSLGFFERRSHRGVPIKWCALNGDWAGDLIEVLSSWANQYGVEVYDEVSGKGLLRHAVARMIDQLNLTMVINGVSLPHMDALIEALKAKFGAFTLYISQNTAKTNVIMGERVELKYGEVKEQNLGAFKAVVSPKSFLQVNAAVRDLLYDGIAAALADFDGAITELYSGVGLLTCQLALRLPTSRITAVEIERDASLDAARLTKKLRLNERVRCVCADARQYMRELEIEDTPSKRALVLDPPRKGCADIIDDIKRAKFDKIVYASCDPQTLARDIKSLSTDFKLASVKPYDMFPQTAEVECLAILERIS